MKRSVRRLIPALLCLFLSTSAAQAADRIEREQEQKFLRFVEDDDGGGKLEAAVVTYQNDKGVRVHLVSAVHVGERQYYDGLNKLFATYDALLYEMVKPKDAPVPEPGFQSGSMIGFFQRALKDVLELEYQLDAVNYQARNFVHADLDAETFERLQSERGENLFVLMLRQILNEMSRPQDQRRKVQEPTFTELIVALTSPDSARHLKMMLGRQFEDIEAQVAGFEGPNGSVILTERNKAAMNVLDRTLAEGRKNIGIFYGAAHMNDLARRLNERGFRQVSAEWRAAWDMTPKEGDVVIKVVKKKPATQPADRAAP